MSEDRFQGLEFLAWALYLAIFVLVGGEALHARRRAALDMALFFGATAWLSVVGAVTSALGPGAPPRWLNALDGVLLMALPYLLLRLVVDFTEVPTPVQRGTEAGLVFSALVIVALPDVPPPLALLLVAYFLAVIVYDTAAFIRAAGHSAGITRRRFVAIAVGSLAVGVVLLTSGLGVALPGWQGVWTFIGRLAALVSGVAYFVGFAPPAWLRRAWQEPEVRAFLTTVNRLVRDPDTRRVARAIGEAASAALGSEAAVGLWSERRRVLRFALPEGRAPADLAPAGSGLAADPEGGAVEMPSGHMLAGRAFATQQAIFSPDAPSDDPEYAGFYRHQGATALMAAPITAGERRLGVLVGYAARPPIFAQTDLELAQLLADQAAVVLESRLLVEEATRARAREEADRLKDEFLSAISHDLRNPLTAVQGVAQVLERRLARTGTVEPERLSAALTNIRSASSQMAALIDQLLDHARLRMGRPLELERQPTDLVDLARRAVETYAGASERHRVRLEADPAGVTGMWDELRLERVLQNLLGNALKYSPDGGEVVVRVWVEPRADGPWAAVAVRDQGLGIPAADLPRVFEPFRRGQNVAGRVPGTGLGLAGARQIVEQHGGTIQVESREGEGTTVTVRLPLSEARPPDGGGSRPAASDQTRGAAGEAGPVTGEGRLRWEPSGL